jgi:hypothetical protein
MRASSVDGRKGAAGAVFDAVMGRGGSLAQEKEAFVVRFAVEGSPLVAATPKERVCDMFLALLLNPHFLLAK